MQASRSEWRQWQQQIIRELGVREDFDADAERERRISFLADYLSSQGLQTYVLGISGGVDSSTAGGSRNLPSSVFARAATRRTSSRCGCRTATQRDEADAQLALQFVASRRHAHRQRQAGHRTRCSRRSSTGGAQYTDDVQRRLRARQHQGARSG